MPQAEQESRQHAPMPAQMPEGGLHMAPGMQPQGQPSSLGMAEAGRGAGPQPTAAEQGVAGRDGQAEMREANPFRSGSAQHQLQLVQRHHDPCVNSSVLQIYLLKSVQRPWFWHPSS